MRRTRSIIEFLLVLVSIASCSVMQIKRTQDLTERLVKSLYQKNGNAFYLSSTHASFSTVWTHTEDMVIVYRLQKGKRKQMLSFMEKGIVQFAKIDPEDIEKELYQKCALELDGDVFGFIIDVDGNMLSVSGGKAKGEFCALRDDESRLGIQGLVGAVYIRGIV